MSEPRDTPARGDGDELGAAPRRAAPTRGSDDELLRDPPAGAPPGGLDGYRAGRRLRLALLAVGAIGVAATAWWIVDARRTAEAQARAPKLPSYTLSPDVDPSARTRRMVWTEGPARLGLAREQPGVEEIVLPDRRIVLAPGHDVAQLKLDVQDGKTVELKVLVGEIVQLPPEPESTATAATPPAPAATGP